MSTRDARPYWDLQASIYASDEGHHRFGRFLHLYEQSCWGYIEPVLPEPGEGVILEAGCGVGRWVLRLAPMGYEMVLTDLSPEMIKHARARVEQSGLGQYVKAYHVLDICDMNAVEDASFDLVLVLGGPLSLCRDARLAVQEVRRVTKRGGYVICDAANRYRTALNLVRDKQMSQVARVLDSGEFSRANGLCDHRFSPQELGDLFEAQGMQALHIAGLCPFFDFLPSAEDVAALEPDHAYEAMLEAGRRYAEDPSVVALSGRLLIVARRIE
jgi:ubiquinone/menaquinone biosynthesis C-methylase UbiE